VKTGEVNLAYFSGKDSRVEQDEEYFDLVEVLGFADIHTQPLVNAFHLIENSSWVSNSKGSDSSVKMTTLVTSRSCNR
jgi:hypothetical protein